MEGYPIRDDTQEKKLLSFLDLCGRDPGVPGLTVVGRDAEGGPVPRRPGTLGVHDSSHPVPPVRTFPDYPNQTGAPGVVDLPVPSTTTLPVTTIQLRELSGVRMDLSRRWKDEGMKDDFDDLSVAWRDLDKGRRSFSLHHETSRCPPESLLNFRSLCHLPSMSHESSTRVVKYLMTPGLSLPQNRHQRTPESPFRP